MKAQHSAAANTYHVYCDSAGGSDLSREQACGHRECDNFYRFPHPLVYAQIHNKISYVFAPRPAVSWRPFRMAEQSAG